MQDKEQNIYSYIIVVNVLLYSHFLFLSRCNVLINMFEDAHKVQVSDDQCEACQASILNVDFNKVGLMYIIHTQQNSYSMSRLLGTETSW